MSQSAKLELVSFKVCPFVQRSVIALNAKGIAYTLTHINPHEPPDWFKAISPLGKVPVLLVDGTPLFESAVILEYVDEVYPPRCTRLSLWKKRGIGHGSSFVLSC
ncbi:glutathione S-transferase family protein [Thiothrix subterranea]|uniref:glutathione S-transferase family protein n=1 Tax=Thiothrix subterranea TaxID=2735563 RepID=UPI001D18A4E2|nr:glutathione S-transferase N-terminal domain-containing protein [Thiothrix subterranea]